VANRGTIEHALMANRQLRAQPSFMTVCARHATTEECLKEAGFRRQHLALQ